MYVNDKNNDVNNPILDFHGSVSEGICAVCVKRKSDSPYSVKKKSDIIKRTRKSLFNHSKIQNTRSFVTRRKKTWWMKSNRNVVVSKYSWQHSPVGKSAANGAIENAIQRDENQSRSSWMLKKISTWTLIRPATFGHGLSSLQLNESCIGKCRVIIYSHPANWYVVNPGCQQNYIRQPCIVQCYK